jgi:hypothetical protein
MGDFNSEIVEFSSEMEEFSSEKEDYSSEVHLCKGSGWHSTKGVSSVVEKMSL